MRPDASLLRCEPVAADPSLVSAQAVQVKPRHLSGFPFSGKSDLGVTGSWLLAGHSPNNARDGINHIDRFHRRPVCTRVSQHRPGATANAKLYEASAQSLLFLLRNSIKSEAARGGSDSASAETLNDTICSFIFPPNGRRGINLSGAREALRRVEDDG